MSEPSEDLDAVWRSILAAVSHDGVPAPHRAFLSLARFVGLLDGTALVAVPNNYCKTYVERALRVPVTQAFSAHYGQDVRLAVTVDPDLDDTEDELPQPDEDTPGVGLHVVPDRADDLEDPEDGASPTHDRTAAAIATPAPTPNGRVVPEELEATRLNPKYTFDTFVIGASNRFAHAATVAVAEAPARAYNPLFVYGGSGLGKTHLLHAIGHYARNLYPNVRVRYVNSEEFTNDFINAIQDNRAQQFQRRYRDVDILLIDDIQFLSGKMQTQEEFFHTFNTLHNANKQVVITSDVAPKMLGGFEERMRSRFEWGLLTDIQPPDLETRIAILRRKVAAEKITVEPDVLEFIASRIHTNIRELEGALIRVTAFASLNQQPVDTSLAEVVLKDLIPEGRETPVTPERIIAETADYFDISADDLLGTSRAQTLVTARQIAMYLCRELTDLSLPKIGAEFGGKDHTTVMHADRKIRALMGEQRQIFNQVSEITNRIKQY